MWFFLPHKGQCIIYHPHTSDAQFKCSVVGLVNRNDSLETSTNMARQPFNVKEPPGHVSQIKLHNCPRTFNGTEAKKVSEIKLSSSHKGDLGHNLPPLPGRFRRITLER